MVGEKNLRTYLDKFDRKYWATYKVLDILQKVSKASFAPRALCWQALTVKICVAPGRSMTSVPQLAGVLPVQPRPRGLCRDVRV